MVAGLVVMAAVVRAWVVIAMVVKDCVVEGRHEEHVKTSAMGSKGEPAAKRP